MKGAGSAVLSEWAWSPAARVALFAIKFVGRVSYRRDGAMNCSVKVVLLLQSIEMVGVAIGTLMASNQCGGPQEVRWTAGGGGVCNNNRRTRVGSLDVCL